MSGRVRFSQSVFFFLDFDSAILCLFFWCLLSVLLHFSFVLLQVLHVLKSQVQSVCLFFRVRSVSLFVVSLQRAFAHIQSKIEMCKGVCSLVCLYLILLSLPNSSVSPTIQLIAL